MAENGMNTSTDNEELDDDDEDALIDTEFGLATKDSQTFRECFSEHIETIWDFCDGLEYQLQCEDNRMLETVERKGASSLRLAHSCLSRKRRMNSLRGSSPTTWERKTAKAMFYRTRLPRRDVES